MRVYGVDIVKNARCRKAVLCDYDIVWETPEAYKERCAFCGREIVYRKGDKASIDNRRYGAEHIRHLVQPTGRTRKLFAMAYGEEALKGDWSRPMKYRGKKEALEEFERTISDARNKVSKWTQYL